MDGVSRKHEFCTRHVTFFAVYVTGLNGSCASTVIINSWIEFFFFFFFFFLLLLLLLFNHRCKGIFNYIPETGRVSRIYKLVGILCYGTWNVTSDDKRFVIYYYYYYYYYYQQNMSLINYAIITKCSCVVM